MAVNVRIPGVGNVVAENAATENTLRQLVTAITQQQGRARRADSEIAAASRQQAGFADRAADSMGQMASNAKSSESAARSLFSNLSEQVTRATNVVGVATQDISSTGVTTYLKQLGTTAIEVSAMWAKNYGDIRDNPLKMAKDVLDTGVDAAAAGMGATAGAILKKMGEPFESMAGGAESLIKGGLKTVNKMLYDEVNQTIKAYSSMSKMGASFTRGVDTMRAASHESGLLIDQFSGAISKAEPNLKLLGLTTDQAIIKTARVANAFGSVETGGITLRNQLRGLGYSTEEQVELAAQYMANLRGNMTQEKFNAISNKDIALQTRQYAEDLKVLADITGKNAKAAQEEARMKSMEADIMARLGSKEEIEKFQAVYRSMPDAAKKGFLEYVSTGGQAVVDAATNIAMAQNREIMPMYEQGYRNIYDVGKNAQMAQDEQLAATARVGEEQRRVSREAGGAIIQMASRLGASGLDQIANFFNSLVKEGLYDEKTVKEAREKAKLNAQLTGDLTTSLTNFQNQMQNYASGVSQALDPVLGTYMAALNKVSAAMNKLTLINVYGMAGKFPGYDKEGEFATGRAPTEKYTPALYKKDLEEFFRKIFRDVVSQLPGMAKGGMVNAPTLAIVGEAGPEAVIPLASGKVPVEISGPTSGLADLSNIVQTMQSSFSSILASAKTENQDQNQYLIKEQVKELPTALSSALETVLSGPSGLVQTMTQVKTQIADDNRMQMEMMQQQIESLTKLVDTMQENVRYSERLANELA
jgi:hypothetical protein